jgi:hypothetical protein
MRRTLSVFPVCALLLLGACEAPIPLRLPVGAPLNVSVSETHNHFTIAPDSDEYRQLALWIERNQSGWSRYRVTLPICGICVSAGDIQLNFLGSSVIAVLKDGVWDKPVAPSDYAFLNR